MHWCLWLVQHQVTDSIFTQMAFCQLQAHRIMKVCKSFETRKFHAWLVRVARNVRFLCWCVSSCCKMIWCFTEFCPKGECLVWFWNWELFCLESSALFWCFNKVNIQAFLIKSRFYNPYEEIRTRYC